MYPQCVNYHLGHMMSDCFAANPERVCQIDAATGETETNGSVLFRVKRVVRCFRKLGLQVGDVLALGGKNHLDLHIPYYAALMSGLPIAAMDPLYKYDEILSMFSVTEPKIAFCQKDTQDYIHRAVKKLGLDTKVVLFDGGCTIQEFMKTFDDGSDLDEFRPAKFDGSQVYAWLTPTSGTTGTQKFVAFNHQQLKERCNDKLAAMNSNHEDMSGSNSFNLSTVQWISAYFNAICYPLFGTAKVQTSDPATPDHLVEIITKYRPRIMLMTPWSATAILNHASNCDLTCFRHITLTGSKVPKELIVELRARTDPAKCQVVEMYGQTETLGPVLVGAPEGPLGNCGKPYPPEYIEIKLVDPDTEEEVTEPHKPGEVWLKRPRFVYYRMPEETAKSFTPDGWYKTGDLLYRDAENYYYFHERMKMLIQYKNYRIAPVELEQVISTHPAVAQVAVSSVEDSLCGELAVACVVLKPGATASAGEIQQLVASKLSESKQLRGGVIFMDGLPATSTGKMARGKLRELVRKEKRNGQYLQ